MTLNDDQMVKLGAVDTAKQFVVVCRARMFADRWVVVRARDRRVMTDGSVTQCARWVNVWGPMYQ